MPAVPMSYREIADDLIERIEAGEYPPGSRLPSYAELKEIYSVGVTTVASALVIVRERGLIFPVSGRGNFVRERDNR